MQGEFDMSAALIGIIGGSGLYQLDGLEHVREERIETPYGVPSDNIVTGTLVGIPVAFLARHGRGHRLLPSEVPYRANIYALKKLGIRYLLSFSAVGSLREDVAPLDFVLPDQYIDLTKQRESSFFGDGVVAHVSMAHPVCSVTSEVLSRAVQATLPADAPRLHQGGAYVCIEGPQFSSLAESNWYRSMGASVIGMTNMPEAKLAREAQIAYTSLAMVTDYDCWHPKEAHVTADMAIANLMMNAERAKKVATKAVQILGAEQPRSSAHFALQHALVTPADAIPDALRQQMKVILR